ncbi:MAG: hypothetical protein HYR71_08170, partial [Chloroflexi bacterium]|nr:hypothetical protein [Chloroflexota bacterium]
MAVGLGAPTRARAGKGAGLNTRARFTLWLLLAAAACALYLGVSQLRVGRSGFPLDDAWIHLTFARNLALRHELAHIPGQLSAGSTSPLWTFVLAPAFLWPLGVEAWVDALGVLLIVSAAALTYRIARQVFGDAASPLSPPLSQVWERGWGVRGEGLGGEAALVVALEWHLDWAAFSGMETLFFIVLLLLALDFYYTGRPLWWVGLAGGLAVITRPEGVGILGLIAVHWLMTQALPRKEAWKAQLKRAGAAAIAFAIPIVPYIQFNWAVSGQLFPNTFYAKQAEFAQVFAARSVPQHFLNLITVPFVGAQVLLIPGFALAVWLIAREKRWNAAILLGWWLMLPAAYAIRLPVDYQHGRYEMPVIPMIVIVGLWGTHRLQTRLPPIQVGGLRAGAARRVLSRVWRISFPLLLVVFWLRGAQAFATDVDIMDCMAVQTAQWLSAHTQPDDLIAVHDVGAVGYYLNGRPLLDLAGLITPEVIPFIRDESRLMDFIAARRAVYLVTSAFWHPAMINSPRVQEVHHQDCPVLRREGG